MRATMTAGLLGPLLLGEPPVTHRPGPGEHVVTIGELELFTPLLLDIGIFLLVVGLLTMLLHHMASIDDPESPDGLLDPARPDHQERP